MKIEFNEYYDKRLLYIINHVKNGVPRFKVWYQDKDNIYKFKFTESTFPEYLTFAYTKKPKDWFLEEKEEKKKHRYYFQWNTRNILSTLNKALLNKKLTKIQGMFLEELFLNFKKYEDMMIYVYNTDIFEYNIEVCPF